MLTMMIRCDGRGVPRHVREYPGFRVGRLHLHGRSPPGALLQRAIHRRLLQGQQYLVRLTAPYL